MLGISTCWWHNRADGADRIVDDILQLGLDGVELEYRLTHNLYREMTSRLTTSLPVLSIHNFFPIPEGFEAGQGSGDLFLLSSADPEERSRAVKYSIRTIEHAHELGAPAVVLHLGRVDMPSPAKGFSRRYSGGRIHEKDLTAFMDEQRSIRGVMRRKNFDAVRLSLEELADEAVKRGVLLGIENRYHFHEIPDFEEIGLLLEEFHGGDIGYWHDVGHARAQENLGILRPNQLLEAYAGHMIGIHLHDARGLEDHLAPGQGDVDFEAIKSFLDDRVIRILEVHPNRVNRKALIKGIEHIREIGI